MRCQGLRVLLAALASVVVSKAYAGNPGCAGCAPAAPVVASTPCTDCGPTLRSSIHSRISAIHSRIASHPDIQFMCGSSANFFAPCNNLMKDFFGGNHRFKQCGFPTYGSGIGQPADHCKGPTTYLNR